MDHAEVSKSDIEMLRSEHGQIKELARVVVAVADDPDFGDLIEQLRAMIDEHVERELAVFSAAAAPDGAIDQWLGHDALVGLHEMFESGYAPDAEQLIRIVDEHLDRVEGILASVAPGST